MIKAKVIKTESEYEAALARIEKLMDAKRNTPQGDELELLTLFVHDYEDRVYPIAKHLVDQTPRVADNKALLMLKPSTAASPAKSGRRVRASAADQKIHLRKPAIIRVFGANF